MAGLLKQMMNPAGAFTALKGDRPVSLRSSPPRWKRLTAPGAPAQTLCRHQGNAPPVAIIRSGASLTPCSMARCASRNHERRNARGNSRPQSANESEAHLSPLWAAMGRIWHRHFSSAWFISWKEDVRHSSDWRPLPGRTPPAANPQAIAAASRSSLPSASVHHQFGWPVVPPLAKA